MKVIITSFLVTVAAFAVTVTCQSSTMMPEREFAGKGCPLTYVAEGIGNLTILVEQKQNSTNNEQEKRGLEALAMALKRARSIVEAIRAILIIAQNNAYDTTLGAFDDSVAVAKTSGPAGQLIVKALEPLREAVKKVLDSSIGGLYSLDGPIKRANKAILKFVGVIFLQTA